MPTVLEFIALARSSPLSRWIEQPPWLITAKATAIVRSILDGLPADFRRNGEIAIHRTATIEDGAVVKGAAIIGPGCFVASGPYLRGGAWLDEACVIGPGSELKSSFMFHGTKLAHFNFVGESILGADVNLEAGSVIANHRNERTDKEIHVRIGDGLVATGVEKFGALVGDGAKIGANAVIAPGALIAPGTVIGRLSLVDQDPR